MDARGDGAEEREMGQVLMDGVLAEEMGEEALSGGGWDFSAVA